MTSRKILQSGLAGALLLAAPAALAVEVFFATCTPSQESTNPVVATDPTCTASLRLLDADTLTYRIDCYNITGVTASHLHLGNADTNGAVQVGLFAMGGGTGAVDGELVSGTITRTGLGSAAFDTLLGNMRTDKIYVNVHTTAFGGGEVRGNIAAVEIPRPPTYKY